MHVKDFKQKISGRNQALIKQEYHSSIVKSLNVPN